MSLSVSTSRVLSGVRSFALGAAIRLAPLAAIGIIGCGGEGGTIVNPVPVPSSYIPVPAFDAGNIPPDSGVTVPIDPSKDCSKYSADKILNEVQIIYIQNNFGVIAQELPGERKRIENALSSLDYRFTQGITQIEIREGGDNICPPSDRPDLGWTLGYYTTNDNDNVIGLCHSNDGSGGAFKNDKTLNFAVTYQIGWHVQNKIGEKAAEYKNFEGNGFSYNFADDFALYLLFGQTCRSEVFYKEKLRPEYEWWRNNIFCGNEYGDFGIIDPANCGEYPPGSYSSKIFLDEVKLIYGGAMGYGFDETLKDKWKEVVVELPGERDEILNIFSSMDYRYTNGICKIKVIEFTDGICHNWLKDKYEGDKISASYTSYSISDCATVSLCRGQSGAIDSTSLDPHSALDFIIRHETGHNTARKMGGLIFEEYVQLVSSISPPTPKTNFAEVFASDFAEYQIMGKSAFTEYSDDLGKWHCFTDRSKYPWWESNIFCGVEFPPASLNALFDLGTYYLGTGKCDEAKSAFQDVVNSGDIGNLGNIGIGRAYACMKQCDQALNILNQYQTAEAFFYIADTYEQCYKDFNKAIEIYNSIASNPEADSVYQIKSLYRMARIYKDQLNSPKDAKATLEKLFAAYPDPSMYIIKDYGCYKDYDQTVQNALFDLGEIYYSDGDCANAKKYLQQLISNYPDFKTQEAQAVIAKCGG